MYINLQSFLIHGQGLCFENESTDWNTIYFLHKPESHTHNASFTNFSFIFFEVVRDLVRQFSFYFL